MKHHVYDNTRDTYPIALLIKEAAYNISEITTTYVDALENAGIPKEEVIIIALPYDRKKVVSQPFAREHLEKVLEGLTKVCTETIYCADATYFKVLTKTKKAETNLGYELPCLFTGYEEEKMSVVLGINHKSLLYNPTNEGKLLMSIDTLISVAKGNYRGFSDPILQNTDYPKTLKEITATLFKLLDEPRLFIDIEGFSLKFYSSKVATIAFATNQHDGAAFICDLEENNDEVRKALKEFFETYEGEKVFHNASYDVKSLIFNLWMDEDHAYRRGMLNGLDVMCNNMHDTKIIAYLATNTTAGNSLGLKELAHEYVGNYGIDVKDITQHTSEKILDYNLTDSCATAWVFDKYYPMMVENAQLDVYNNLFLPSLKTLIQTEMIGMPMDAYSINVAKKTLEEVTQGRMNTIMDSKLVAEYTVALRFKSMLKKNAEMKKKVHSIESFYDPDSPLYVTFNPGSPLQLQGLLYQHLGLPVLERTDTKQPSTKAAHIEALKHHTDNPEHLKILKALVKWSEANKILNTFISAFEKATGKGDNRVWLHGSFNLGGTKSGRLSSSSPNLQNLPSGKTYGKLIKSCFQAPDGWVFGGADFASLEDRISALTTKDKNKLKVYEDGLDGHCLRAYNYWPEKMPDIDPESVESINSIEDVYPDIRQESKACTFLLTYGGTHVGLHKTLGFSPKDALAIYDNYHGLYTESDDWVQNELDKAAKTGYVELAFGTRLKTPLISQSLRGRSGQTWESLAEERTAGNALGQSYGLLNNRACNEFMQRVWDSPYALDIMPIAQIHDALYFIWRDSLEVTEFVNNNLIDCMSWQELPAINHATVTLDAELLIYFPSWAYPIKIPNNASATTIKQVCTQAA